MRVRFIDRDYKQKMLISAYQKRVPDSQRPSSSMAFIGQKRSHIRGICYGSCKGKRAVLIVASFGSKINVLWTRDKKTKRFNAHR